MATKRRTIPFSLGNGTLITTRGECPSWPYGGCSPPSLVGRERRDLGTLFGTQETASENHSWPPRKGERGDVGGNFTSVKRVVTGTRANTSGTGVNTSGYPCDCRFYSYEGPIWPFLPNVGSSYFPGSIMSSDSQLNQLGATGIANASPTNALINLTTFLGEILREGLPFTRTTSWAETVDKVRKAQRTPQYVDAASRGAGDAYLSKEFGWDPVVSDIREVARTIANAEATIAQYKRDAGRPVRRRYNFPDFQETTVDEYTPTSQYPYCHPIVTSIQNFGFSGRRMNVTTEISRKRWFSGAFVYHLPSDWNNWEMMGTSVSNLSKVLSIDITPDALWNLTPWSWAVDWFSNAGDVMHNVSSFANDGLVLKYGYMMEHCVSKVTYIQTSITPFLNGGTTASGSLSFITETKVRRKSSPYGFGLSFDGLSVRQQAILAALGITRRS